MRHDLPTGPPAPLALGMGVAAFAAVLVALARSALGATSGLVRAGGAAVALAAVAVAADEHSAAAAGAHKASGGGVCWAVGMGGPIPMREAMLLDSHARFVKY